ncbi:Palmitoyltransferase PFA4 [Porphyridium purpureum]|uniref:Palmitoyltransferase n=1 Tax=Porphyridium purpureum TaxID=35688 RepID=A0A5J4Z1J8_PORPP|nr:Palmitoyltransferase PFA4 [Porphyridium purpureum]|eukprot:POR3809..scf295_1
MKPMILAGCIEIWGLSASLPRGASLSAQENARRVRSIRYAERVIMVVVEFVIWFAAITCNLALLHWDPCWRGSCTGSSMGMNIPEALFLDSFVVLLQSMYLAAMFVKPGSASDWAVERPDLPFPSYVSPEDSASDEAELWCKRCRAAKPRRVHHCSSCEVCVAKLDHHCLWTGNCVGVRNHKYFTLFLLYVTIACSFGTGLFIRFWMRLFRARALYSRREIVRIAVLTYFGGVMAFAVALAVGGLLVRNIFLACLNQTTLESIQKRQPGRFQVVNYSTGSIYRNLQHAFGHDFLLWPVPVSRHARLSSAFWSHRGKHDRARKRES